MLIQITTSRASRSEKSNKGFKELISTHAYYQFVSNNFNILRRLEVARTGYIIKPSETEKLLGGHLHQNLQFRHHMSNRDHKGFLVNQLIGRMTGLKKLCVHANIKTRLMVANGLIISKLSYLIILWGGTQQYLVKTLQVQQFIAARIVCEVKSWRWSRSQLLGKVGWLSVKQLVFYHSVLQAHK